MTATFDAMLPMKRPLRWNVFFAEESDRDLDFDEGFEEDELHQSKPPSRRPLLWILLLVLVGGVAYWVLNDPSSKMQKPTSMDSEERTNPASQGGAQPDLAAPLFQENQTVVLADKTGVSMLMGDPTNSQPGPIVKASEHLTVLDGSYQITGWIYLVKTESGKTGWISGEKIKKPS
jgi:hypothetical protein